MGVSTTSRVFQFQRYRDFLIAYLATAHCFGIIQNILHVVDLHGVRFSNIFDIRSFPWKHIHIELLYRARNKSQGTSQEQGGVFRSVPHL